MHIEQNCFLNFIEIISLCRLSADILNVNFILFRWKQNYTKLSPPRQTPGQQTNTPHPNKQGNKQKNKTKTNKHITQHTHTHTPFSSPSLIADDDFEHQWV